MSLAELIRESSKTQHRSAESSEFIARLMRGELDLGSYTRYLINMAWLYDALEGKIAEGEPLVTTEGLWDERLNRIDSITKDLEALGVINWRNTTKPSQAMSSYIAHINSLNGKADHRLIAHHYTRYMGDLSGGQAIATLVARHYGATADQLTFYTFAKIEDIVRYKEHYRQNLDSVILDKTKLDELVREVQLAFEYNQRVFEDLAQHD